MELIRYLNKYFFTKQQLLDISKITNSEFEYFISLGVMPKHSYKLKAKVVSDSFFGEHIVNESIEYFAKGYAAWIGSLQILDDKNNAFLVFSKRYRERIAYLAQKGFVSDDPRVNGAIDSHIEKEWISFIDGIYGLCTKSGLPEDIASKELATLLINSFIGCKKLNKSGETKLANAVDLLDLSSSLFAPHERRKSSRHRLINEVRRQFKLETK